MEGNVTANATDGQTESDVTLLNWDIDIVDEGEIISAALDDVEEIPAGDEVAVEGDAPAGQYLYVLAIDVTKHEVTVLFDSGAPLAKSGKMRVPANGWMTVAATGPIRVVAADEPVAADEWIELLGVRDPPPGPNPDNSL
jgi:hypothetical protein